MFRIQKVLQAEFDEIYEPMLIENPFTLVDSQGLGLRQYQIGLTCSRLIFGCDNFAKNFEADTNGSESNVNSCGNDADIECFSLVSMMPLQFIRFNFYRKHERYLMVITINPVYVCEKPMTFEFGGHVFKQHFWNTWRERVASMRVFQPLFNHLTYASPFSSTDIQLDEEQHVVSVHNQLKPMPSMCHTLI